MTASRSVSAFDAAAGSDDSLSRAPASPRKPGEAPRRRPLKPDLAVIGAGSAGLSAAAGAAMLGLDVVLFEKAEMGGDCLNYGCVPSKSLLSAAKAAQSVREASKFGVGASEPEISWDGVKTYLQSVIETIAPVDSQERFEGLGVTVIREHARFADKETLVSDSVEVRAKRVIVATGSRAFVPPIPGLDKIDYLTNETIFSVPEQPEHLVILGGGPIGIEMAQAFRRLGSEVTVIERAGVLGRGDPDHAEIVKAQLRGEGVILLEGHSASRVEGEAGAVSVTTETETGGGERVTGTHILVALGRHAVLDGLALEAGGVATDEGRSVAVDGGLRSTSNKRVWALGDVAGKGQFTHLAGWHASVFIRRAFYKQRTKADALPLPAVTYTAPEMAQLGLTEAEAREAHGDKIETASFPFHENDRAIAESKTAGEVKLILKGGDILGASVVGEGAGDIIQLVSVAMSNGLGVKALTNFISPYPTRAEAVKRAASAHFAPKLFGKPSKTLVGLLQRIP